MMAAKTTGCSEEKHAAHFSAALVLTTCALGLAAFMTQTVHKALTVPSAPAGAFRQTVHVEILKLPANPPKATPDAWQQEPPAAMREHTVEESDFGIAVRNDPPHEIRAKPPVPEASASKKIEADPNKERKKQLKVKPKPKPQFKLDSQPKLDSQTKLDPVKKAKPEQKQSEPANAEAAVSSGLAEAERTTGAGVGSSGTASIQEAGVVHEAIAQIMAVIEANKTYPRRALQTGQQGVVVLSVHIGPDGIVEHVEVHQKHAFRLLNRAAMSAAVPLVGIKTPLGRALTLEVPVKFEIRR